MNYWILFIFLLYEAIEDLKSRSVSVVSLAVAAVVGIVGNLFLWQIEFASVIDGSIIGLTLIAASIISMGAFGLGDGVVFLITGIYLGGAMNLELVLMAMLMAMLYGMVMHFFRRKIREIPFIPCIFLAYMEVMYFAA